MRKHSARDTPKGQRDSYFPKKGEATIVQGGLRMSVRASHGGLHIYSSMGDPQDVFIGIGDIFLPWHVVKKLFDERCESVESKTSISPFETLTA